MSPQNQADSFGPKSGNNFRSSTPPSTRSAVLIGDLCQGYFRLCALTTDIALNEIVGRQIDAMRIIGSQTPLHYWAPFEQFFNAPFAIWPLLAASSSQGSAGRRSTVQPDRRVSAVVINFPDRQRHREN